MSLSKGKCWYNNECLHILNRIVPLDEKSQMFLVMNFDYVNEPL
jgi:hypothetical protein